MPLNIKHPEVDALARQLAERTGETITEAVLKALRERTGRAPADALREELALIRRRCSRLPVLDSRSADEILGFDDRGLPT